MAQSIGLRVGRTHHLVTGVVAIAVLAGSEGSAASPNLEQLRAVPEAKLEKFGPVQAAGRVCGWALVPPTADRPARLVISFWSMANRRFFATFAADLATGKVRRVQEPGFEKDAPRWPSVVAGDGKHVFSCMNGGLAVYDPDADSFKLVRPISRASWLRGLAIGADGAVYMSDYPTGSAARYDLCTGKVEDYGLDYKDLKYNPCNDIIIPSVIRTDDLQKPLGRYYMYYAPHNAPGGICMAYADAPEGPWKEYEANPLIARDWTPHYKVSHVSGPHAIWIEEEKKLFVYYHGENDVTRIASTADGIHFQYEGVAVTTKMFDAISEASYARVFRYTIPGKDNRYIMLLMGNNRGTRRIYLAWSKNGRNWEPRRSPILDPPAGTNQIALKPGTFPVAVGTT